MTKELLEKYLNNQCTSLEVEEVISWMKQQSFLTESRELGEHEWQQFKENNVAVSDEKLNTILDKIHHKINLEKSRVNQLQVKRIIRWISKAAAVFLIPVLAFLFYVVSENSKLTNQVATVAVDSLEVIAPVGSRTVVELSDGSVVHLNYGSKIKYPQNFIGEKRGVLLTGEAYFDVAHNPDKPFVVTAEGIDVRALGTIFNINAYVENDDVATTLVEGKVLIEGKNKYGSLRILKELVPGQHVIYEKNTGAVNSSIQQVDKYIAWKDGKLVFENESIIEVAARLSRIYNVEIKVDNEVTKYKYTVTFVDEPLFQILELLSIATPIKYTVLPRTKNPDGTFSKQIIRIEKKK